MRDGKYQNHFTNLPVSLLMLSHFQKCLISCGRTYPTHWLLGERAKSQRERCNTKRFRGSKWEAGELRRNSVKGLTRDGMSWWDFPVPVAVLQRD